MYRDGGGFTAYVILEWATICHPRMGHNMSSPNGPQYVILEWATICHPRMGHNMSSPNVPIGDPVPPSFRHGLSRNPGKCHSDERQRRGIYCFFHQP